MQDEQVSSTVHKQLSLQGAQRCPLKKCECEHNWHRLTASKTESIKNVFDCFIFSALYIYVRENVIKVNIVEQIKITKDIFVTRNQKFTQRNDQYFSLFNFMCVYLFLYILISSVIILVEEIHEYE